MVKGRRDQVLISTKGSIRLGEGPNDVGSSRWHLARGIEASLNLIFIERERRLNLLIERIAFDGEAGTVAITFRPSGIKSLAVEANQTPTAA